MEFDAHAIGYTIRRLRLRLGMSQELLSGLAGIARTHLTMIESGKKQPNLETVWKIALSLQILPSELLAEAEEYIRNQDKTQEKRDYL